MSDYIQKHPIFNYADDIAQICSPLARLNITYFTHVKINTSKQFSAITNNPDFADHYLKNKYYNADIHLSEKNLGNYVVWDGIERTSTSKKMHTEAAAFGVQHTFTIINKTKTGTDYYHFANNSTDKSINQFYITHVDLLKSFILHFNDKVKNSDGLSTSYDLTFSIDKNAEGYSIRDGEMAAVSQKAISEFIELLSVDAPHGRIVTDQKNPNILIHKVSQKPILLAPQQYRCLALLCVGKTIKQIAQNLSLSPRTVEHYLANVRKILSCGNNKEMIAAYCPQLYSISEFLF